jgi:hypothetical protein
MRLVVLGTLQHAILAYPEKGHTHGPLDGTFGQICVKLSNTEFNSAAEVVEVLQSFLTEATFDGSSNAERRAYKMDESASWESWWDEVGLELSDLTGPLAPHWFHICKRQDLDLHEFDSPQTSWAGAPQATGSDIVVAVKDRMSSLRPHQVALLIPGHEVAVLQAQMTIQPEGLHSRRSVRMEDRKLIQDRANEVFRAGGINAAAHEFLTSWASGTLRREPRPHSYDFLCTGQRRPQPLEAIMPLPVPIAAAQQQPRPIAVHRAMDLQPLPAGSEEVDAAPQHLVVFEEGE